MTEAQALDKILEIKTNYRSFIIFDLGTIHHRPLTKAVNDIHTLLARIDELEDELKEACDGT
jgi:hypothetical protein